MGTKLSSEGNELYQRVDEVLHYIWDPIGIRDFPQARDEYDAYLPTIFRVVNENKSAGVIAGDLMKIEEERMGMKANRERAYKVADILLSYRKKILGDC